MTRQGTGESPSCTFHTFSRRVYISILRHILLYIQLVLTEARFNIRLVCAPIPVDILQYDGDAASERPCFPSTYMVDTLDRLVPHAAMYAFLAFAHFSPAFLAMCLSSLLILTL